MSIFWLDFPQQGTEKYFEQLLEKIITVTVCGNSIVVTII